MENLYIFGIDLTTKKQTILGFNANERKFFTKSIPSEMKVWNYSSPVYLSEQCILISGGISDKMNNIVSEFYYYNPSTNKATKLPNMSQPRYTHMSIFFKNKYYVIGGRYYGNDNVSIMKDVECFDIVSGKWEVCAALLKPRCTGSVLIYDGYIFVFGGYTG